MQLNNCWSRLEELKKRKCKKCGYVVAKLVMLELVGTPSVDSVNARLWVVLPFPIYILRRSAPLLCLTLISTDNLTGVQMRKGLSIQLPWVIYWGAPRHCPNTTYQQWVQIQLFKRCPKQFVTLFQIQLFRKCPQWFVTEIPPQAGGGDSRLSHAPICLPWTVITAPDAIPEISSAPATSIWHVTQTNCDKFSISSKNLFVAEIFLSEPQASSQNSDPFSQLQNSLSRVSISFGLTASIKNVSVKCWSIYLNI